MQRSTLIQYIEQRHCNLLIDPFNCFQRFCTSPLFQLVILSELLFQLHIHLMVRDVKKTPKFLFEPSFYLLSVLNMLQYISMFLLKMPLQLLLVLHFTAHSYIVPNISPNLLSMLQSDVPLLLLSVPSFHLKQFRGAKEAFYIFKYMHCGFSERLHWTAFSSEHLFLG